MSHDFPHQVRNVPADDGPATDPRELHVASPVDADDARSRADQLEAVLIRVDVRDQAAERRDREAEGHEPTAAARSWIERDWAGRDRDSAAGDRADLIAIMRQDSTPRVDGDATEAAPPG